MPNHIASSGYVIEKLISSNPRKWQGVGFAVNSADADKQIAERIKFNGGTYRAMPAKVEVNAYKPSGTKPALNLVFA